MPTPRRVIILGSTGSIGTQALDVVSHLNAMAAARGLPPAIEVVGLAARRRGQALREQAAHLGVQHIGLAEPDGAEPLPFDGPGGAERMVQEVECDLVLAAMVGSAGLPATLAAVHLGRDVALANKESLVAAGMLVMPAAAARGASILPVDSEHSGVWQCLLALAPHADVASSDNVTPVPGVGAGIANRLRKIVLTASGGPFRTWDRQQIEHATPDEALRHPTWRMGAKVTIDSASLMNKALELIEARWLFDVPAAQLEAVVHPQSLVHALVELHDGALLAHISSADMRLPIQLALSWPQRKPHGASGAPRLTWRDLARLEFEPPDLDRFPCLRFVDDVIGGRRAGTTAGAVVNAANEAAVDAFLHARPRAITFGQIPRLITAALQSVGTSPVRSLSDVLEAEREARRCVHALIGA